MSTISKEIEIYLKLLINNSEDNIVEIQRNALAEHFNCVPSQINYVLSTRSPWIKATALKPEEAAAALSASKSWTWASRSESTA